MGDLEKTPLKWTGSASAQLLGVEPDLAWSLLGDFCSLHKFLPSVATCHKLDGADGLPGCVRYCTGSTDEKTGSVYWVKERLLEIDSEKRSYSYEIVENNMGFGSYFATLKVRELGDGCEIEWVFDAEPVVSWTRPGLVGYIEMGVKEMAKRVGDALKMC